MIAARKENMKLVEYLVNAGVDVNAVDKVRRELYVFRCRAIDE